MPKTYTLRAEGRTVRTTAGKRYHVAVPSWVGLDSNRLKTTKRTDSESAAAAEVRRLVRAGVSTIYTFEYGELIKTRRVGR